MDTNADTSRAFVVVHGVPELFCRSRTRIRCGSGPPETAGGYNVFCTGHVAGVDGRIYVVGIGTASGSTRTALACSSTAAPSSEINKTGSLPWGARWSSPTAPWPARSGGTIVDNVLFHNGRYGIEISSAAGTFLDLSIARNLATGNILGNYTLTGANAAPVTSLASSPGAWDNVQ